MVEVSAMKGTGNSQTLIAKMSTTILVLEYETLFECGG